jgi:hypothetical protein
VSEPSKTDQKVEWIKPLDSADFLGPRRPIYSKPLVLDDGTEIDRNAPGPFGEQSTTATECAR